MRHAWLCLAVMGCSFGSHDSGSPESTHAISSAVLNGANDSERTGVVLIAADYPKAPHTCTGFLVTPHLVLTARHCVSKGGETCEAPFTSTFTTYQVSNALTPEDKDLVPGGEVHLPETNALCGNDIAFLELPEALANATPIALRLAVPPKLEESVTVVGYAQGPEKEQMTRKSISDAKIVSIGVDGRLGGPTANDFTVDHGACEGDSGGPALDEDGVAVGIVSRGPSSCKNVIYQRVDAHAEWIRGVVADVSARMGDAIPEWAAAAPTKDAGAKPKGKKKAVAVGDSDDAPATAADPSESSTSSSCAMSSGSEGTGSFRVPSALATLALVLTRRRRGRRVVSPPSAA